MDVSIDGGPLLIFGGPYSNRQASEAIRRAAGELGVPPSRVICTGDAAAYCADPEETVRLIRDWGCHVVKGNCEDNLARRAGDCGCGFTGGSACDLLSRSWYAHADAAISEETRRWMSGLPDFLNFEIGGRRFCVLHGAFRQNNRFIFESTPKSEKRAECAAAGADIVIAGHCGIPFIEKLDGKLWFNPGAIGMPANDGTPDGWYGLIERRADDLIFSIRRLPYDWRTASMRLRETGVAPAYARTLESGLWPSLDVLPEQERARTGAPIAENSIALTA